MYANKVIVNYTGLEFILTVVSAFPEPWAPGLREAPKEVDGRVLARFAFSPPEWVGAVKSFQVQVEKLESEGLFKVEEIQTLAGEEGEA